MAKVDKVCYKKRNENLNLKGKQKRNSRIPMHPRSLLHPFSCSVLCITQKSKENILAYPLMMLQRKWERCGVTPLQVASSLMKRRLPGWGNNRKRILPHTAFNSPVHNSLLSKKKKLKCKTKKRKMLLKEPTSPDSPCVLFRSDSDSSYIPDFPDIFFLLNWVFMRAFKLPKIYLIS